MRVRMRQNVGGWDRNLRLACGTSAVLAALVIPLPKSWKIGLLTLGATELLTATTRYCPLNHALGVNTKYQRLTDAARQVADNIKALAE